MFHYSNEDVRNWYGFTLIIVRISRNKDFKMALLLRCFLVSSETSCL